MNSGLKSAFTLFELIVAMSITSVIALIAYTFTEEVIELWDASESNMALESEVNAAMDDIASDIESAIFRENSGVMFAVDALDDDDNTSVWDAAGSQERPTLVAFDPQNDLYGWAGSWVRFFTAAPTANAVSYQIVRRKWFGSTTKPMYRLHRSIVTQDHTIAAGFDITASTYEGSAHEGNPGIVKKTNQIDIILNNVIDFGVRLYVRDSTQLGDVNSPEGLRIIFPANGSGVVSNSDLQHSASTNVSASSNDGSLYPDAVEVVARVLDSDGAELLYQLEEEGGTDAAVQWEAIVSERSKVYRRFVEVRSRSL